MQVKRIIVDPTRSQPAELARKIAGPVRHGVSLIGEQDLHLFREGTATRAHEFFGAHLVEVDGEPGTHYAVWAPNAQRVSVVGDFNGWQKGEHLLSARWEGSGIWEGFVPGVFAGAHYKYHIASHLAGYAADKADPYARFSDGAPGNASIVWSDGYEWRDSEWLENRRRSTGQATPTSIYEVHLGSWRRDPWQPFQSLTYRQIAEPLAQYVKELDFTHVELMPVMEHPFYGSWGYQATGYFSPTSRYGSPQDLKFLIDILHQNGIGVILDWVPSHFPTDEHGLGFFDGTHLYEHADPRLGFHPVWKSNIFNYGRNEVRSFLLSSANYWLDVFHADGLRVDAVPVMLYRDYDRQPGEWLPNQFGGHENLEGISFLQALNSSVGRDFPDARMIAEDSSPWPAVTRPVWSGGLGFNAKWNMGWMNDALRYFSLDPIFRRYHQEILLFSLWYANFERYLLPLSHDEVVHGKGSLLGKMPGDDWQKFANLRLLFGYMFGHPGQKLLFMGGEFGQRAEWNHDRSLDWDLLRHAPHQGLQRWVGDLNRFYRERPALYELDGQEGGFSWVDFSDRENSIISFLRQSKADAERVLAVLNFTPMPRHDYRIGVPFGGYWRERLNSDAEVYGGSGLGNLGGREAEAISFHGLPYSLSLTLPPLSVLFMEHSVRP